MSIQDQFERLDVDINEVVDDLARTTLPGESNDEFTDGLDNASVVLPLVIEDLQNWFEVVDIRIYGSNHIGIPMRYRWSIIRWSNQGMDNWLMDRGWKDLPHLNADTREREENELEARYRKMYGEVIVDANFMVEFPDIVFRKLDGEDISEAEEKRDAEKRHRKRLKNLVEGKRSQ